MALISLSPQRNAHPLEDHSALPIFSVGFRPFFFLASLSAALLLPLWLMMLSGVAIQGHFQGVTLHAHEMIFGFILATIVGFLLTAGANWSDHRTTNSRSLAALSALWVAGRVAIWFSNPEQTWACLLDIAFLPWAGIQLGRALIKGKSRRNYQFLGMLAVLSLSNVLMHAEAHRPLGSIPRGLGQNLALTTITFMILVMGGRVIPMFTKNATGVQIVNKHPWLDRVALAAFLMLAVGELAMGSSGSTTVAAALWIAVGALHLVRMGSWGTRYARAPLLWILHVGFFSTALSLVLKGGALLGLLPASVGMHVLTLGGMSALCLGMMTRVSLGHSGRKLVSPPKMTWAFAMIVSATILRVTGALSGRWALHLYMVSGALFSAAFVLLLIFGVPIWFFPRQDART